jgi:hypothetical protein
MYFKCIENIKNIVNCKQWQCFFKLINKVDRRLDVKIEQSINVHNGMCLRLILGSANPKSKFFLCHNWCKASLQKNGREIILDLAEAATRGQNGLIEKLFSSSSQ